MKSLEVEIAEWRSFVGQGPAIDGRDVGELYTGGAVGSHERRMDFVRFTGEWCIYYALIA